MNNSAIGVYDSGFGGLSVWGELYRALPDESLTYLGDGKNCPYGGRTREQITGFAREAVRRLVDEGCKMIVVACNTATAAARVAAAARRRSGTGDQARVHGERHAQGRRAGHSSQS